MATENPYFTEFEQGTFKLENINVKVVGSRRTLLSDNLQQELDQRWDKLPGDKWPGDTAASKFRYEGCEIDDDRITLLVSPTLSYKDNAIWDHSLTKECGDNSAPLPISFTELIQTSDNKLILTRRLKADYKRGGLSGVGGFFEIKKDSNPDGTLNTMHGVHRETHEETRLEETELSGLVLHSIVHNPVSGSVDLVFSGNTQLTFADVKARKNDGENNLEFIDLDSDVLQNLVLTKTNAFTVGVLSLLINKAGELMRKAGRGDYTEAIFKLRQISYAEAIQRGPDVVKKLESRDSSK